MFDQCPPIQKGNNHRLINFFEEKNHWEVPSGQEMSTEFKMSQFLSQIRKKTRTKQKQKLHSSLNRGKKKKP